MTELWLIRHGQTDWNLAGRWQGQASNAPGLNETGRVQALATLKLLTGKQFAAIYSSDLLRSRQTAELIAETLGLDIILEPRLREIDLGEWEGMLSRDIEARCPEELAARDHDPLHAHAPRGESLLEVAERVIAAINDITKKYPDGSILIVSHGVSLAVIICHSEKIPMKEAYEHVPENAQPYCVTLRNDG
jgi:broad specificity phosphatase PhoE